MNNKFLAFIKKYKIVLVLSLGMVLLMKFTEKDYKEEYELANNKIVEVEGNISKIEKENNSEELNKEINDLKDKSGKLSEEVTEKETKYDNLEAEKEEKLEKEKREAEEDKRKAEEEKKRIEAEKKLAEERKEQTTNNITTAKPNNSSNTSTSGSQNKPQVSPNNKPATNKKPTTNNKPSSSNSSNSSGGQPSGSIVYANGGSSKSNKYHKSPTAHKMEGAIKMTESQAKNQGYVACKICY